MNNKDTTNIRMHGDIAVASFELLLPKEVPTFASLIDGTAKAAGWMVQTQYVSSVYVSARRALKGIKRESLFGELDLNGIISSGMLTLTDGEKITSEAQMKELFVDDEHALIRPLYADWGPFSDWGSPKKREIIGHQEIHAFALVPGRYPNKNKQGLQYAPNIKKADPYSTSQNWKLFRGLFFRRPN